jgi:hypothetical protein
VTRCPFDQPIGDDLVNLRTSLEGTDMADEQQARIAIDDVVEAASTGVLRALEARKITVSDFTRDNGFSVKINIEAGGFPIGPVEQLGGGIQRRSLQE